MSNFSDRLTPAEIINDAISRYLGEFSNGVSIQLVNAPYAGGKANT